MRTVTFRIAETGAVIEDGAPEYVPWVKGRLIFARTDGDYATGKVLPRSRVLAFTDAEGEGTVALEPGTYRITLPSDETFDRVLEDGEHALDLADWLAVGFPPHDPLYPTVVGYVEKRLSELPPGGGGPISLDNLTEVYGTASAPEGSVMQKTDKGWTGLEVQDPVQWFDNALL